MTKLSELEKSIQAILFASGDPYEKDRLAKILEIDRDTLEKIIERINELYKKTAFVILELDQSYQMVTRAEYAQVIQKALEVKNNTPLSQAALEVLAIIAYNQPVTKSFIEQVRGVDSGSVVNSLVAKGHAWRAGKAGDPRKADFLRNDRAFSALLWNEKHRSFAKAAAANPDAAGRIDRAIVCSEGREGGSGDRAVDNFSDTGMYFVAAVLSCGDSPVLLDTKRWAEANSSL